MRGPGRFSVLDQRDFVGDHVGAEIAVGLSFDADTIARNQAAARLGKHVDRLVAVLHEEVFAGGVVVRHGGFEIDRQGPLGLGIGQ